MELRSAAKVEHGQTTTKRLQVFSPDENLEFEVKWKATRPSFDGVNNSPRKEIAAYLLQRLVLEPEHYVVPTTSLLCLPPDGLEGRPLGEPLQPDMKCVTGAVSLWLQEVQYPEPKVDWARFSRDPAYAHHAADFNLIGILMDHSDTHTRNMLVSKDPKSARMFSIDNGISFNSWFRSPFSKDWNRLRVPGLRADTVDRLRELQRHDLDSLLVVAELRVDEQGLYQPVSPGPLLETDRRPAAELGVRSAPGAIQLGLTAREIDAVWRRVEEVVRLVDQGTIPVF